MPKKVNLTEQQILVNRFAFLLLKHFRDDKIKVQDFEIKINTDQMCSQDILFLSNLSESLGDNLGINIRRSGGGVCLLLGVAKIKDIPDFLAKYKR